MPKNNSTAYAKRDYLTLIQKTKSPKKCKQLIEWADKEHIAALCECLLNVLIGNIKISPGIRKEMGKYKTLLRQVISKSISTKARKKLLKSKYRLLQKLLPYTLKALEG